MKTAQCTIHDARPCCRVLHQLIADHDLTFFSQGLHLCILCWWPLSPDGQLADVRPDAIAAAVENLERRREGYRPGALPVAASLKTLLEQVNSAQSDANGASEHGLDDDRGSESQPQERRDSAATLQDFIEVLGSERPGKAWHHASQRMMNATLTALYSTHLREKRSGDQDETHRT